MPESPPPLPGDERIPVEFESGMSLTEKVLNDLQQVLLWRILTHHHDGANGVQLGREAIKPNAVGSGQIEAAAVTGDEIAPGSVGAGHVSDGAVQDRHLAADAVRTVAVKDGQITLAKLAAEVKAMLTRPVQGVSTYAYVVYFDGVIIFDSWIDEGPWFEWLIDKDAVARAWEYDMTRLTNEGDLQILDYLRNPDVIIAAGAGWPGPGTTQPGIPDTGAGIDQPPPGTTQPGAGATQPGGFISQPGGPVTAAGGELVSYGTVIHQPATAYRTGMAIGDWVSHGPGLAEPVSGPAVEGGGAAPTIRGGGFMPMMGGQGAAAFGGTNLSMADRASRTVMGMVRELGPELAPGQFSADLMERKRVTLKIDPQQNNFGSAAGGEILFNPGVGSNAAFSADGEAVKFQHGVVPNEKGRTTIHNMLEHYDIDLGQVDMSVHNQVHLKALMEVPQFVAFLNAPWELPAGHWTAASRNVDTVTRRLQGDVNRIRVRFVTPYRSADYAVTVTPDAVTDLSNPPVPVVVARTRHYVDIAFSPGDSPSSKRSFSIAIFGDLQGE